MRRGNAALHEILRPAPPGHAKHRGLPSPEQAPRFSAEPCTRPAASPAAHEHDAGSRNAPAFCVLPLSLHLEPVLGRTRQSRNPPRTNRCSMARPVGPFSRHAVLIRDLVALPLTFASDSTKPARQRVRLLRTGQGARQAEQASQPRKPLQRSTPQSWTSCKPTGGFFVTFRDVFFAPYRLVFVA